MNPYIEEKHFCVVRAFPVFFWYRLQTCIKFTRFDKTVEITLEDSFLAMDVEKFSQMLSRKNDLIHNKYCYDDDVLQLRVNYKIVHICNIYENLAFTSKYTNLEGVNTREIIKIHESLQTIYTNMVQYMQIMKL
jgi:hypothetical protein